MTPQALFPWQAPADSSQIYFDCNATTPTLPVAARAALATMEACFGNPSSAHMTGLQAKHLLESTRALARKVMGACKASGVVFTSGATEGIQMAVFSALERLSEQQRSARAENKSPLPKDAPRKAPPQVLLYGATEHKAVPQALKHWVRILGLDLEVKAVPVDARGLHDLDFLREHLPHCPFLATMAVNNETGVVSNLAGIAACLREADAARTHDASRPATLWLVDCVQALGKIPLSLAGSRIDYATFSGHKLYAPKGVGVLYARPGVPLVPLIVGGGQEGGIRSGTENLPGVAALGEILRELDTNASRLFASHETCMGYRNALAAALMEHFPGIVFNAPFDVSVPTTLNFSIPGFSSRELLDLFDAVGMRLSAGSACSAAKALRSDVLDAMGVPEWRSLSAVRMSFGPATSASEIERGVQAIEKAAKALKDSCVYPGSEPASQGLLSVPSRAHGVVQFPVGNAHSWVVTCGDERTCVIIDPCPENADRIVHFLECQGLKVLAVLDTHLHADHVSPRPTLEALLHLAEPRDALGFPDTAHAGTTREFKGLVCRSLALGPHLELLRFATPGHTGESVSFLLVDNGTPRFLFCGDLILPGGLGRTNFPSSDPVAMFESLQALERVVPDTCVLCAAHDYSNAFGSLWGVEKNTNPLLALALERSPHALSAFIKAKQEHDAELSSLEENTQGIMCGVVDKNIPEGEVTIAAGRLRSFLHECEGNVKVIDVREPWEWTVSLPGHELLCGKTGCTPENVPVSRFVNLVGELLALDAQKQTHVALLCRSGTRSLHVARSLRRLGFHNVWSLEGGLAFGLH